MKNLSKTTAMCKKYNLKADACIQKYKSTQNIGEALVKTETINLTR